MKKQRVRVNQQIRISPVRLIGPDGEQIGIVPTKEAIARAEEEGLDLVEVSPNSRPPVCRILDYGKYKYNLAKKAKTSKKRQHAVSVKEMRYRPKIEEHDFQFKTRHVREFLEQGNKVKCFVMFRGREKAHTEFGRKVLDRVAEELEDIAIVENSPRMEGSHMNMLVIPKPEVIKKLQKQKTTTKKVEKSKPESKEPGAEEEFSEEEVSEEEIRNEEIEEEEEEETDE